MPDQNPDDVERVAVALAKAEGFDFYEVCGLEAGKDECESNSCVSAFCEDHDAALAREQYLKQAIAALAAAWGWRPIETAPKEGKFLIAGNGKMMIADGLILQKAIQPHTPNHLSLNWAKYWQPLPQPPESSDD